MALPKTRYVTLTQDGHLAGAALKHVREEATEIASTTVKAALEGYPPPKELEQILANKIGADVFQAFMVGNLTTGEGYPRGTIEAERVRRENAIDAINKRINDLAAKLDKIAATLTSTTTDKEN